MSYHSFIFLGRYLRLLTARLLPFLLQTTLLILNDDDDDFILVIYLFLTMLRGDRPITIAVSVPTIKFEQSIALFFRFFSKN